MQPLTPEQLAKLMAPYQRDGRRASEDDLPEDVWLKVRFTQPYKEDVDTAGDPVGAVRTSQMFFDRGRAEVALLRRGGPAEFKKGDVGLFPQDDAKRLINQEKVCELIEPVYVRPLNDYEFGFRSIALRLIDLDEAQRGVERALAEVQAATALVQAQIGYREQEREKVKSDLQKTQLERDRITEYAANLQARWAKAREELSALYRTNSQLAEQLVRLDQEMTEQINRRAAEAVGTPP